MPPAPRRHTGAVTIKIVTLFPSDGTLGQPWCATQDGPNPRQSEPNYAAAYRKLQVKVPAPAMPCRLRLLKVLMLLLAYAATPASGAAAQSPVNIIVTGPATGRYAEYLGAMSAAAQRAATALSSAETADGAMPAAISVTDVDDGCNADRARGAARLIVGMKPDLVIGHPCPAAAMAAAPIYAEAGVVFIALGVRHPELTDKRAGPTIFRLSGREDRQGEAAAAVLSRSAPEGRIAIVQDRTAYARSLLEDTTVALEKLKRPAPVVVPIVAGRRDYSVEIEKLVSARAEAVFFAGYPSEAAVLLRGMRRAGLYAVFIGSDANATSEFADTVVQGELSGKGVSVLTRAEPVAGKSLEGLSNAAETAVEIWFTGAQRAGTRTGADIAAALAMAPIKTTGMGVVAFGSNGDAGLPSFAAATLVDGRWSAAAFEAR